MMGIFGNQVYNAPTMESYGGIYASDTYSTFHAPSVTFRSGKSEIGESVLKLGKWTDEGVALITRGLNPEDLRLVLNQQGIATYGGSVVADLGEAQLLAAVKGQFKKQGVNGLNGMLKSMRDSGTEGLNLVANKIVKNLADEGIAVAVVGAKDLASYGAKGTLKTISKPVGETVVEGTGKTWDDLVAEGAETAAGRTALKNTLRGVDGKGGVVRFMQVNTKGNVGKIMLGGLLIGSAVAPNITGPLLGMMFTNIGMTLKNAVSGDDNGDSGSMSVPECPDVGKTCETNIQLQAGCICNDDDGDGTGVIDQQGFKLNYEGYMIFGGIALAGVVLFTTIIRQRS